MQLGQYINDFLSLTYPSLCNACGKTLIGGENIICSNCLFHLPIRDDYKNTENKTQQHFWGRFPTQFVAAFLDFHKGNKVQNLLHRLKYDNKPEIGLFLGELHAQYLVQNHLFETVDCIVPVPLHKERERTRGYNQSEKYGEGLAKATNKELILNNLVREKATTSQTKKSRLERLDNMQGIFSIKQANLFENKHILLVDDVITTGATIEACAIELLNIPNVKISICSIASAC